MKLSIIPKLRSGSRQGFQPRSRPKCLLSSTTWLLAIGFFVTLAASIERADAVDSMDRPNILFIAIDDLNDWVGCLGGHPQAKTPNIDALAKKGVLFEQAHCAAPLCSPSRTAIMMGLRPSTTGIYGNLNWFRDIPQYKDWVTLPQYFRKHGYVAWGGGKLYHQAHGKFSDAGAWDHVYSTRTGAVPPPQSERYKHGLRPKFESNPILARLIDWGPTDAPLESNPDWKTADGAAQFLKRDHEKPFFLGCGIYLPHLPWYAPKKFFDMHPLEDIELPPYMADDFDDIPVIGRQMGERHIKHIRESGKWKDAVQGCLAADSFADACVGHVLEALEKSRYRDNTIVVLWGDHGYDVGEKKIAKSALWEQTTRTPLIVYAPGKLPFGTPANGKICKSPISLVDLYPTLIDLCGLPENTQLDGQSFAPLIKDPNTDWPVPAVITHSPHWYGPCHAVRSRDFHYIRYSDGGEELYDVNADPLQRKNLADESTLTDTKAELRKWIPTTNTPHYRGNTSASRGTRQDVRRLPPDSRPSPKVVTTSATTPSRKRPNVITLYVDDLGYRDLGCYGGPVKTPVIDKLAAGGVRFTDFHSGAPTCSPSRATFLTGRQHCRTGVYSVLDERFHRMHLLESETTIAEVLQENGYATAHFGKWHLGMPVQNRENPTPADHGFDDWFGVVNGVGPSHKNPTNFLRNGRRVGTIKGYSCQIVVDEALAWLDQKRDGDEPFFFNLWFNEPHDPIAAPDEIVSQYGALNEREAIYSGTIDNTDRAIGRLVQQLEKLGELDNTIIIYASDNGSYLQERNGELRGKKGALFEGGHRVPGIFYWKGGIPGGRVEKEPAGVVDLLPTLCGLIGIDKPKGVYLDGSDLTPLLTSSGPFNRHQPLFWMAEANMVMRVGDHTLFASSTAKSPIDFKTADRLMQEVKEVLGDDLEKELGGMDLRSRMFNGKFANLEANRLRDQHRRLYYFQESWIPELKKSELGRVGLYDLSKDLGQQDNIAEKHPELAARLKAQAAAIYRSVMADAPEWPAAEELAPVTSENGSGARQEFRPSEKSKPLPTTQNNGPRVSTTSATERSRKRPNVVILLADDLGSGDLGCYGGPVKTPVLDSLAARGVKFTDFHAGAAVCSPSRATLITGRQNLRTGIYGVLQDHWHNMHLLEREVTIAEVLQQAGYGTAHFGKWHIGMTSGRRQKPSPTEHGFDYWFGLSNGSSPSHKDPVNFFRNGKQVGPLRGYSCQLVVDDAINWLETKEKPDQPFFMNIWFNEPHHKLAAPDEIVSIYGDLNDEAAIYSATVDNTDRAIGRLVEKLKATGKLDNTLIIYSSDHGSYRSDRNGGLNGNKGSNFQGGLRSPGIFFWPGGFRGGRVENTPSGSVDLLPTICGLAGIDQPKAVHLDGADLSPLLVEKGTFKRTQPLLWLSPSSGHLATLREGKYTLMGYRGYQLPSDQVRKNELLQQMAKMAGIDPSLPNLGSKVTNTTFSSPEYNQLKSEFVRLRTFQEAWIPTIKAGGFSRFALYDLSTDPLQKKDISKQRPEVTERLKKTLLALYKDVMADAPDWEPLAN
ncbi:MAG: sulfatase-like hydrolase/transferase [Planctomycetota bacterium]|nr:sulfatase-like hydrolase/transferase [Planctomycetota bacterium]